MKINKKINKIFQNKYDVPHLKPGCLFCTGELQSVSHYRVSSQEMTLDIECVISLKREIDNMAHIEFPVGFLESFLCIEECK